VQWQVLGLGADGTVGANKSAIKIIGDNTDMYAQAYFAYGLQEIGRHHHLALRSARSRSSHLPDDTADYVACHKDNYWRSTTWLGGHQGGRTFVLNSPWTPCDMEEKLPAGCAAPSRPTKLKSTTSTAVKIAAEVGLGGRINMIMQTAFFQLASVLPVDKAIAALKDEIRKMFARRAKSSSPLNHARWMPPSPT